MGIHSSVVEDSRVLVRLMDPPNAAQGALDSAHYNLRMAGHFGTPENVDTACKALIALAFRGECEPTMSQVVFARAVGSCLLTGALAQQVLDAADHAEELLRVLLHHRLGHSLPGAFIVHGFVLRHIQAESREIGVAWTEHDGHMVTVLNPGLHLRAGAGMRLVPVATTGPRC